MLRDMPTATCQYNIVAAKIIGYIILHMYMLFMSSTWHYRFPRNYSQINDYGGSNNQSKVEDYDWGNQPSDQDVIEAPLGTNSMADKPSDLHGTCAMAIHLQD